MGCRVLLDLLYLFPDSPVCAGVVKHHPNIVRKDRRPFALILPDVFFCSRRERFLPGHNTLPK